MIPDLIGYILLGLFGGLSEMMPISASANFYLFATLLGIEQGSGLVDLTVHIACFAALILCCGKRIAHLNREMRIVRTPARRRKRQPDMAAVLDARVISSSVLTMAVPMVLGSLYIDYFQSLPVITVLLAVAGVLIYIPQHFPGGNRESRGMSKFDGWFYGAVAGLSVLPGMSRLSGILCGGLLRGCDRKYILEIAFMVSVPFMLMMILLELLALVFSGFSALNGIVVLGSLLAGLAAFAGSCAGISFMRFLAVRAGFSGFAFYSWGMAMLTFILYLMT